jgi:DegV family protein with EDD domain
MNEYVILTDSCSDLPLSIIEKGKLEVIPLSVKVKDKQYQNFPDERDITNKDFYTLLREHQVATTSQIIPSQAMEKIEPILKEGKDVLCIMFSSALSGTYNSVLVAKSELEAKYPNNKIIVIDSLSASLGQGLLVNYALELKNEGKSIDEVASWIEANKLHICHLFTVDDLNHLKRGGRLSSTKAFLGTVLQLKPVLHVDDLGRLVPLNSVRGRKAALKALVDRLDENIMGDDQMIFISHGDCLEDAKFVEELIREKHQVKDVVINYVGPVIGAHSGPGTIALFFFGKTR